VDTSQTVHVGGKRARFENGDSFGRVRAENVRAGVEERLELYESSGRGRELLRAAHERRDIRHCTFSLGRIGGLVNDVRPRASDFKPQMSREDHDTLDRPDSNTRISPDEFWPVDVVSPRSVGRVGVRSTYLYPTS